MASQCQISTSALRMILHVRALSTVKRITSGEPGLPSVMFRRVRSFSTQ